MNGTARILSASSVFLVASACAPGPPQQAAVDSRGPLEGVWSVVTVDATDGSPVIDPAQPGLYIFTATHYSAVYAPGPDPRVKSVTSFLPTDEEMMAQYQSIIVNSGTYEVEGSAFTVRPMIAKSPGFVGGRLTGTFTISGDTLVLHHERLFDLAGSELQGFGEILTLVRLE